MTETCIVRSLNGTIHSLQTQSYFIFYPQLIINAPYLKVSFSEFQHHERLLIPLLQSNILNDQAGSATVVTICLSVI